MIEFRILGPLDLRDPDNGDLQAILARPKQVALLAYLTLAGGLRHRDELLGVFWPETSQARGRRALSQALYRLRSSLGDDVVVSRGTEEVGVDPAQLWCDALEFGRRLADESRAGALELYRGDLLNGLHLDDAPAFEEWLTGERERLMKGALESACELAGELAAGGQGVEAAYWLRRALRWEPYDEDLLRRLLTLLSQLGDRAGVIREYEAFARRYADELALEPEAATRGIVERARAETGEAAIALDEVHHERGKGRSSSVGAPVADMPTEVGRTKRASRWRAAAASALVAVVAVVLLVANRQSEPAAAGSVEPATGVPVFDPRRIVLLPFENRSGDPQLDPVGRLAADWIAQELAKTGLVRPVLPIAAVDSLRLSEGTGPAIGPQDVEGAARLRAGHLVAGWYTVENDSIVFQAQVARVPDGEIVHVLEHVAGPVADPSASVERLRQRATGALAALVDPQLKPWIGSGASQPPSFQVYREFAHGIELWEFQEYRAAADAFHRAASHDTMFTAPLVWAVRSHQDAVYYPDETRRDARQAGLADSVLGYLEARRARLPAWESDMIDYLGAGDRDPYMALRRVVAMTPEPVWVAQLAGMTMARNRPREALEILLGLDPELTDPEGWNRRYLRSRMDLHHVLGEYEEEAEILEEFLARYPPTWPMPPRSMPQEFFEIRVLAALGREAELERAIGDLLEKAGDEGDAGIFMATREAMLHGHEKVARRALERDLARLQRLPHDDDPEELWRWGIARTLALLGRYEEAQPHYERMLERARPESDNRFLFLGALGAIAAHRGDRAEALRYNRLLEEFDVSSGDSWWKQSINIQRAQIAVVLGDRRRALTLLADEIRGGMPLFTNVHHEMFRPEFDALRGHPAYEALTRPR